MSDITGRKFMEYVMVSGAGLMLAALVAWSFYYSIKKSIKGSASQSDT